MKPSCLGWNWKKIGQAGLGPKFCISFQVGSGSGRNFIFPFGPGRAGLGPKFQFLFRAEIFFLFLGPGPVWKIRPVQTSTIQFLLLLVLWLFSHSVDDLSTQLYGSEKKNAKFFCELPFSFFFINDNSKILNCTFRLTWFLPL